MIRKIALVTGASRGIGRSVAIKLAHAGMTVAVNYAESAEEAQAVVQEIRDNGGSARAFQADIADLSQIRRMCEEIHAAFGNLDVLIANAGYCIFKPLIDLSEEEFDRMFAVNAKGTFFVLQQALRRFNDDGCIVCVSTIGTCLNLPGGAGYFGSKAAVEQFCRTLAREVAPRNITVNVVSPGFTDTQMLRGSLSAEDAANLIAMTPLQRLGVPNDVADAIAFLASGRARWITRQNIAVDGGIISR